MAIGLVGKPSGVRIITGSVHYGKLRKEAFNLQNREFPDKVNNRTVLIMGQTIKQEIVVIQPTVVQAMAEVVKKARAPRKKKVVAEA